MKDLFNNEFHPTEMYKLINLCLNAPFKVEITEAWDAPQVLFLDKNGNRIADAVCHAGSYGHEKGLLEVMGVLAEDEYDDVEGWLTAEEVYARAIKCPSLAID